MASYVPGLSSTASNFLTIIHRHLLYFSTIVSKPSVFLCTIQVFLRIMKPKKAGDFQIVIHHSFLSDLFVREEILPFLHHRLHFAPFREFVVALVPHSIRHHSL